MNVKTDSMFDLFSVAQKDTDKGIGPKDKKKQVHTLEIIGESGLELFGEEKPEIKKSKKKAKVGEIEWNQVKSNPDIRAMNAPIDEWVANNFYIYAREQYKLKYKCKTAPFTRPAGIDSMKKLKEDFDKMNGIKPNPQMIVDYIDWFYKNKLDGIISIYGSFNIQSMKYKTNMKEFCNQYSLNKSYTVLENPKVENVSFSNMNAIFRASKVSFIMKYGIVFTLNWLMKNNNMNELEAKDIVMVAIKDAMKEGESAIVKIVSVTKNFSPYPLTYKKDCLNGIFSFIVMSNNEIKYKENVKENF